MNIKRFLILSITAALIAVAAGCGKSDSAGGSAVKETKKQKYHCPMHPTYVSDRPGDCPICNMKLVPIKDNEQPAAVNNAPDPIKNETEKLIQQQIKPAIRKRFPRKTLL